MDLNEILQEAASRAPALAVFALLLVVVFKYLQKVTERFLAYIETRDKKTDKTLGDMTDRFTKSHDEATVAIHENTKTLGRMTGIMDRIDIKIKKAEDWDGKTERRVGFQRPNPGG